MKLSLKVRRSARVHDPGKFLPGDYELIDCSLMLRARKTAHDGAEQMEKSPRFFTPVASAAIEPVPMTPALFTMRTTPPASAAAKPISLRLRKVRCVFLPASQNADRLVNTCKQSAKGGTASEAVHASTHALTSKGRDCSQYRIYCDKGISGATENRPALNDRIRHTRCCQPCRAGVAALINRKWGKPCHSECRVPGLAETVDSASAWLDSRSAQCKSPTTRPRSKFLKAWPLLGPKRVLFSF